MGGFVGRASLAWEMYGIKDRMVLRSDGLELFDTGCVGGSGRRLLDIAGGEQLSVEVLPNCEGTTGTAWNFRFACPAEPGAEDAEVVTVGPTSGRVTSEIEPNDRIEEATAIALGAMVAGTILPRGDADLYALDLPAQGELRVHFAAAPPELDMAFRVLDEGGRQVWGWQTAPGPGEAFEAWADIVTPGRYFLEVRDGGNTAASPEPYLMVATLRPTADTGEPNDTIATATPLALGAEIEAAILPRGDADLYALDLPAQGELRVSFAVAPPELDMAFRVLDETGRQVWGWQTAPEPGAPLHAWADIAAPGRYFLEVRDGGNTARSPEPYSLVVQLAATADTGEPNDTVETATPLALGAEIEAAILPRGDADIYALDLPAQGELRVGFARVPAEIDVAFRVLDEAGRQVWGWQTAPAAGAPFHAWADIAAPGRYFLEVRDGGNTARSPEPYSLVVQLAATADSGEPNDTVETATPLALGEVVSASILPRGDADHYRLELARAGRLVVAILESPSELDMAFRVLDADGRQVWGWQTAPAFGATFQGFADIATPGRYFLELRDGGNTARSPEPYRLRATLQ
jgi:hypothetical protein